MFSYLFRTATEDVKESVVFALILSSLGYLLFLFLGSLSFHTKRIDFQQIQLENLHGIVPEKSR